MSRFLSLVLIALLMALAVPASVLADHTYDHVVLKYEIVVELEPDQDPALYPDWFLSQVGVPEDERAERINHVYRYAITGFSVFLTSWELAKAERLFADGPTLGIASLSLSREMQIPVITSTESGMTGKAMAAGTEVVPTGVQRIGAISTGQNNYGGVDVAVIDTGVDQYHPDLNYAGGKDCTVRGGDAEEPGVDGYGHGTHVAGTIGAMDNDLGVVGVAPGARIWSAKVLDASGSGSTASVICGIDWVAEHADEIEVANMSLGGSGVITDCGGDDPMHNALCVASEKTIFVVAAGNSNTDASNFSPANYPEAVTVSAYADFDGQPGGVGVEPNNRCAAMSVDDSQAAFSNFGPDVDIAAPGTCILSTLPSIANADGALIPQYGYASGTSMAAPHVTGAVGRYLSVNPDQRDYAAEQVMAWSEAHGGPVAFDRDGKPDALLWVGGQTPRHQAPKTAPPSSEKGSQGSDVAVIGWCPRCPDTQKGAA